MSPPLDPIGGSQPVTPADPDAADHPAPPDDTGTPDPPGVADEMRIIRELILQAHPDVVPELVQGATLHELLASVPIAREAWRNAVERLRQAQFGPPIPSGASVRSAPLDLDSLSPLAKIRAAVG